MNINFYERGSYILSASAFMNDVNIHHVSPSAAVVMATGEKKVDIEQITHKKNEDNGHQDHTESSRGDVADDTRGLFGYTNLHEAASTGDVELLRSLLSDDSNGNDVNGKTVNGGYTPLHLAASAGHAECVEELLKYHKTDIHVTDGFNKIPLETAEQNFKNDVAKLLRSHGKRACASIVYPRVAISGPP